MHTLLAFVGISPSSKLVMLPLNLHLKQLLMIITLSSGPLQPAHLILFQPPSDRLLQLATTNLGQRPLLLGRSQPRLEARLHAYSERGAKGRNLGVAPQFHHAAAALGLLDRHKSVALRLQLKRARRVGRGYHVEGLERGHGLGCRREHANLVAG